MAFRKPAKMRSDHHVRTTAMKLFGSKGKMERPEQREEMALVLRMSADPRFQELARRAMNKIVYGQRSFAWIAEDLGLTYPVIAKEYSELQKAQGFIRAAEHLPDLMEQVMVDAKSVTADCKVCKGTGEVLDKTDPDAVAKPCEACGGEGEHYVPGDIDRVKLALETFQIVGGKANVAVNVDLSNTGRGEGLGALAASVGPLLEGRVVDQTPKEAPE